MAAILGMFAVEDSLGLHENQAMESMYISAPGIAKRWACSQAHVYRLIERGLLPALRAGHVVRVRLADIEKFEHERTTGAAAR